MKSLKSILFEAPMGQIYTMPTQQLYALYKDLRGKVVRYTGAARERKGSDLKAIEQVLLMRPDCPAELKQQQTNANKPMAPIQRDPYSDY